jgi:hypothetical protein
MFQSRVSVVKGHNKYENTDNLYEPLRKTFMLDTTAKKDMLTEASRVSHVTNVVRTGTYAQNYQLVRLLLLRVLRPSFPRMFASNPAKIRESHPTPTTA